MYKLWVLVAVLAVGVPGRLAAAPPEPYALTCARSVYGDLGPDWRRDAIVAGHVAFVGARSYERWRPHGPGSWPLKVLVVVDPNAGPTVTIARPSQSVAALGYNDIRHDGHGVALSEGTTSVRFRACGPDRLREPWNRGTQFAGYFLVSGRRCVHVDIATQGRTIRRQLGFGVRCGGA